MGNLISRLGARAKDQGDRPTCVALAASSVHEYWREIVLNKKKKIEFRAVGGILVLRLQANRWLGQRCGHDRRSGGRLVESKRTVPSPPRNVCNVQSPRHDCSKSAISLSVPA